MFWNKKKEKQVAFEEIFLDASNLPLFNQGRMEGKMELPITRYNVGVVAVVFLMIAFWFLSKIFLLQIDQGQEFRRISENNSLDKSIIIAERGVVYDRNGELLAWNEPDINGVYEFPVRAYTDRKGLGQLIGYVSYPLKDKRGFYYRTEYIGRNGVESSYNAILSGSNGEQLIETDALGAVIGEHIIDSPTSGSPLELSLDVQLSEAMYNIIATSSEKAGFRSGAAAIMDVETGEIIAMTSYPSYDPEVMADGDDTELIAQYNTDPQFPFLNKVFAGVYTPGSIVKPFVAYAALTEGVISEYTRIYSNGALVIPNPYSPSNPSRFPDWRAQGDMTVRDALAFSSNVFFYIIGGGLPKIAVPQAGIEYPMAGLGITKLDEYFSFFGFGHKTGIILANEQTGTVPSPEWKKDVFDEDWRLGNTYHSSIGQFGWQVTPLQMLVAYAALANEGRFFVPSIIKNQEPIYQDKVLDKKSLHIVQEGMHMTTNAERGTALALGRQAIPIAAKSGTAEIGAGNKYVNSWAAGYFPYKNPKYSFILMMDKAPRSNRLGATTIMGDVITWMEKNTPEYLGLPAKMEDIPL